MPRMACASEWMLLWSSGVWSPRIDELRSCAYFRRADSGEAGRVFQGEAGHLFRFHSGQHSDLKPDTLLV